ncbi:hypothetical protein FRB91_011580 [Serendipita sp. 411]|nr:hypothetical protein FRB91_011580 [Serendipita sp. 411]
MPPTLTTPELVPSPSLSSAVDSLSTQSHSISSLSSTTTASTTASTFLPRTIAISLGIFGALVILAGFAIVVRSRIRARTELLRQNLIQDNHNRIYNAGPTTTTTTKTPHPPRLAAAAAYAAAAEPRRLKALSFLQGREGPKEWIPGGAGAGAGSGVKRKRSERSTKSIRKSFLTFSSSLTRKSSAPSGQKSTTTTTAAREATAGAGAAFTLKPYGGGRGVNDSPSTEYLNPAAVNSNAAASVASSPSTPSPRFLEYQTTLQDFTMPQRSNPAIATTVHLQRSQPDGLTSAAATNSRNVRPQVDVLPPIPAQTMPTSTPPMHVRVQMSRVEVLSEPRVPSQRTVPASSSTTSTLTVLPTVPPPIRPAPAPQLGVNRTLAVASPPPPLSSRPLERGVRDRVVTLPGTRTERLPSVASTDEPSLISYYYDGPRDLVFGGKDERPLSTTSFKSPRRI